MFKVKEVNALRIFCIIEWQLSVLILRRVNFRLEFKKKFINREVIPENTEWFMRTTLTCGRLVGSSPTPPLPLPSASCLSFSVFLSVTCQASWRERLEGVGEEPNDRTSRKLGPLLTIQYCLVDTLHIDYSAFFNKNFSGNQNQHLMRWPKIL